MGDYDFNDLVLSQKVVIERNENNEIVDAQIKVSIDAIAGGLLMVLLLYDEMRTIKS